MFFEHSISQKKNRISYAMAAVPVGRRSLECEEETSLTTTLESTALSDEAWREGVVGVGLVMFLPPKKRGKKKGHGKINKIEKKG